MEVTTTYKNLSKEEEGKFVEYFKTKIPAIENLLTKFADDAKILKVQVEKFEKHDAFSVELRLVLPSKEIIANETSHSFMKATDLSKDRLLTQIKKHMSHLQKERAHESIRDAEAVEVKVDATA